MQLHILTNELIDKYDPVDHIEHIDHFIDIHSFILVKGLPFMGTTINLQEIARKITTIKRREKKKK